MIRYFFAALRAQLHGGKILFILSVTGVALGVGAVVSIQIINQNALGAFRGSMKAVSGDADLSIIGTTGALPELLYPEVLATAGVEAAWPIHRIDVAQGDSYLSILGLDLFLPIDLPWDVERIETTGPFSQLGWVAVTPALAREKGWDIGDRFPVSVGTRTVELVVGGFSDFERASPLASPRLAVMDIAQAQSLLGTPGELDQIDVRIRADADHEAVRAALGVRLGPAALIQTANEREQQASDLLAAFRLNLTALSLISLFVGGFLVYSSTQATLVRRRTELGLLRSIGATHGQVFALLLADVSVLAVSGAALGLPLGYLAAAANVDRVSATVSNLYLLEEIHELQVSPWFFLLAASIGIAGALFGALFPALELGRKDTRALLSAFPLHERVGKAAPRLFLLGAAVVAAAGGIYSLAGDRWRPAGFVQAFLLVVAVPLLTPWLVQQATRRVEVRRFGLTYGVKGLGKQLQTTPIAIAAVAVAMSMVVGVTTLVSSFRETLSIWIDATIRADVYVSTPSWRRAREAGLEPWVVDTLRGHPSVVRVDRLRGLLAYSNGRRFSLSGIDVDVPIAGRFSLLDGSAEQAERGLTAGGVLVGEPLARKLGLSVGGELVVAGFDGPINLPVSAIYYDYSSELGSAFVSLATLEEHFGAGPIQNVALYLEPEADVDRVVDDLRRRLNGVPLNLTSNRRLREQALRVFDQTFAVTRLLRYMSLVIAVCGVTLTLLVLARERASELALYRALGAERRQIFIVYLGKGLGMGISGVVLGSVVGIAFALVLVYVVNPAFFGWTIAPSWPSRLFLEQSLVVLAAAAV
ncbi:MAG TPA: FtsX-like permease family protein, partial [Vicinamibacteria bacterium]|nr:FtsX-like permease family protein [Vicinamibacteria bacterium]